MSLFYAYTHLWTYSGLHSARRLLTSLIYPYIHLILRFSGPSLALFSRWQRVHGYTSLIRPRFHSSLHSTSTVSEHFRDPVVYKYSTFYIYIFWTSSYLCQCREPSDFYTIILHLANIFVIQSSTYVLHSTSTFCEHFRIYEQSSYSFISPLSSNSFLIQFYLLFCSLWTFLANIFAEILASFWIFY